jgi:hypothetical protein
MRIAGLARCSLGLLLAIAGCRAPRSDLVEAELRTKERALRETREELDRSRLMNEALEREFLRRNQTDASRPDNAAILSPKDIVLANGTGGVDDDGIPGDEALQVVVVPRDEDGNPVRAVGVLSVAAWEIMPGGVKVPLSTWEVNALDLRRTWKSGLLGSGYHVVLKWKKLPTQVRLRVAVQLKLPDGRVYEVDKDIPIRPLKQIAPLPGNIMPSAPDDGPAITPPAQILPPK